MKQLSYRFLFIFSLSLIVLAICPVASAAAGNASEDLRSNPFDSQVQMYISKARSGPEKIETTSASMKVKGAQI
jgi:hypothetical protein